MSELTECESKTCKPAASSREAVAAREPRARVRGRDLTWSSRSNLQNVSYFMCEACKVLHLNIQKEDLWWKCSDRRDVQQADSSIPSRGSEISRTLHPTAKNEDIQPCLPFLNAHHYLVTKIYLWAGNGVLTQREGIAGKV